tara:strand:+ start:461 stop:700 length:240 start_codon:yes stop_codon:yes gene_type:complete
MSFKPMFRFNRGGAHVAVGEVKGNAQAFATYEEAEQSALNRFVVWTMPCGWFVQESDEPVNYRWDVLHGDVSLNRESKL